MWSRILLTSLAEKAKEVYSHPDRHYHNWHHIIRGYQNAAEAGIPYDVNLDYAWLGHDWVYDNRPDKEVRSIDAFIPMLDGYDVDPAAVAKHIGKTIDHDYTDDNRMLFMDLGDLRTPYRSRENFMKIYLEAEALYGIDHETYSANTITFMTELMVRMTYGARESAHAKNDEEFAFFSEVMAGIIDTIGLANKFSGYVPDSIRRLHGLK